MKKQYQHIVPQVYLKLFGFQREGIPKRWFVSVNQYGKSGWKYRDIKKFLGEYNLYDLESNQTIRIIETGNGKIEDRIRKIISYLDKNDIIQPEIHMDLAETVANFLCRSKICLEWITNISNTKPNEFWELITNQSSLFESEDIRAKVFEGLIGLPKKEIRNNLMLFYMDFVKQILCKMNLVVFKNADEFYLFTSDHPVKLLDAGFGELLNYKFQIYFPLTPNYLIYFYWNTDDCKVNSVKKSLQNGKVSKLNNELYDYYCNDVLTNMVENFIVAPIDAKLLKEEK